MDKAVEKEVNITLPDGSVRTFPEPVSGADVAADIGPGLAKAALAIRLNGDMVDLATVIKDDSEIAIVTSRDEDALELIRHDAAHVMAEAVKELFPETQVTIGPAIEDGFYYDFARKEPFHLDDLEAIEKRMGDIVARDEAIVREEWDRDEAVKFFKDMGEDYKAEIIASIPAGEPIGLYRQGDFIDLCRGPHLPSTGKLGTAFKLTKLAGAYWRGDSRNEMLQRIYGTAWPDAKALKAYLHRVEEAEKRDHRKLGREMDLFHFQEEAQGSVFWHAKGYVIWQALEQYIRRRLAGAGYGEVKTPQLMDKRMWEISGHWSKFRDGMFVVPDEIPSMEDDGPVVSHEADLLALKPMNCPAHIQIFKQGIKSYRDLPIRMAEFGCCHRNEPHGALHGLMRVRQLTQDDAHIFCREDQITGETVAFCELLHSVYKDLGFDDIAVKVATRPELRTGSDDDWDRGEQVLEDSVKAAGLEYEIAPGEGAFYGPKIEFHLRDAIGRSWQCGTLQLDVALPERFDASYVGQDGERHRPAMLHRAILGSIERFIGVMIEHYAGKLPLWLAPTQAVVATITSDADAYAGQVHQALKDAGLRAEADIRNEKINFKVREHSVGKIPVIVVVGKTEAADGTVSVRRLGEKDQEVMPLDQLVGALTREACPPDLETG